MKSGRWSADESAQFDRALAAYKWGQWKKIAASGMIPGRTNGQIKTHAYKRLKKLKKELKVETLGEDFQNYIPTLSSLPDESKHDIPEIPLPSLPTLPMEVKSSLPMEAETTKTTGRSNPFKVDVPSGLVVNHDMLFEDKKPDHKVSNVPVQDDVFVTLKPPSFWESYASNNFTKRDASTKQEVSKIQTSNVDDKEDTVEQVENEINAPKQEINGLQQLLLASKTINDKSKHVYHRTVSNSPDVKDTDQEELYFSASKQATTQSSYGKSETQSTAGLNHEANVSIDPFAKYYEGLHISGDPTMYDFLCDTNDSYFHNVGNHRLRIMIAMRLATYEQLSKFQRMLFIQDFLQSLSGVIRFLAFDLSARKWRLLRNEFAMQLIQKHFDECLRIRL